MLIRSLSGAPEQTAPLAHGGDLAAARQLFPDAPEPFIDLSTGINPHPYPLPALAPEAFTRLPDRASMRRLAAVAAEAYRAPSADHVLPAGGAQSLLPHVTRLLPPGHASILHTTYTEHARAAALSGHTVTVVNDAGRVSKANLAIIVNPNNPDGRIVPRQSLLRIALELSAHGGILIVDELFADVAPKGTSVASDVDAGNIVVLRSFGKFYGLAGVRLGFAVAAPSLIERLDAMLGPWAVSGPALAVGETALADTAWKQRTVVNLIEAAARLDIMLAFSSLELIGGASLYRLTRSANAERLFAHLGRAGILVRRFNEEPTWLRWGLPGDESAWRRLNEALASFR